MESFFFRQGFSSYCVPGASGLRQIKAVILNSDFSNLCTTYRNASLYCLETFDLKSAQSLYAVRKKATKALLFSWDSFFFFLFLLEGIRGFGRQYEL